MTVQITFLGGAGTVTGSRFLVEHDGYRLLLDCGLFQGHRDLRERNWARFGVDPRSIHAVLLTHAHIDHSGYLPVLVRDGFAGSVFATSATRDLCELLLPDSAHLQEEEARHANRRGYSRHKPALPLYEARDAERALKRFRAVEVGEKISEDRRWNAVFRHAGHILGSSIIELQIGGLTLVFSGDLGRYDSETMIDPASVSGADYLVVESTYGNRLHDRRSPLDALAEVVTRTIKRDGTLIIPAFAVGRAQTLLYHFDQLRKQGRLGLVPIFLDSPMAISATELLCKHLGEHRLTPDDCTGACEGVTYVRDVEDSKRLTRDPMPKVVISASGMATGGRILHHLKHGAPDRRNTILLPGYQAAGTRGAALRDGAREIKIFGETIPVRAEVVSLEMMSAHGDRDDLLRWMSNFAAPPRRAFVVHGEPASSEALAIAIEQQFGWETAIPSHGQTVELA